MTNSSPCDLSPLKIEYYQRKNRLREYKALVETNETCNARLRTLCLQLKSKTINQAKFMEGLSALLEKMDTDLAKQKQEAEIQRECIEFIAERGLA